MSAWTWFWTWRLRLYLPRGWQFKIEGTSVRLFDRYGTFAFGVHKRKLDESLRMAADALKRL